MAADQAIDSVHRSVIGSHRPLSCAGLVDLLMGATYHNSHKDKAQRAVACPGVVLDSLLVGRRMPGFAFGYAVAIIVQTLFEQ